MRQHSELSYRQRINRVVKYIHARVDAPLEGPELAAVAAMSRYHFHRVFTAMTGMTPAAYVHRVRLDAAVNALRDTRQSITDIALASGFESGPALGKALRRRFAMNPSAIRHAALDPRQTGAIAPPRRHKAPLLVPRITSEPTQYALCATGRGMVDNDMAEASCQAFDQVNAGISELGLWPKVCQCLALYPDAPRGPCDPDMRVLIGWLFTAEAPPLVQHSDLQLATLHGGRWAVFCHKGPHNTLWQTWRSIYSDWLQHSGARLRDEAPHERYLKDPRQVPAAELLTEIYLPLAN